MVNAQFVVCSRLKQTTDQEVVGSNPSRRANEINELAEHFVPQQR